MKLFRRPELWVFLLLFGSYAYFWQARDWNIASRLMLTYALVDRGTLSIDGLDDQTRDIALYEGHYYSDKTPGFSLMAVAPYALSKLVLGMPDHPLSRPGFAYWPADYWITLGTSSLFTSLSGVLLLVLARDLGCSPGQAVLVALAYGLGTPAFAYATLGYGHQISAFALLASFSILLRVKKRSVLATVVAGFLAAYASVIEIQVGPVSAILGCFVIARVIGKRLPICSILTFGLGAVVPTLTLLGYNALAFGSPWRMGYFYEVLDQFSTVHSESNPLGLGRPDWSKVGELLWGERRGLLRFAPIVALTIPGFVALAYRRAWAVLSVSSLTVLAVFLVNLSYPEWTGGWSTGPRLLLPLLPFAMLPVAGLLAVAGRGVTVLSLILALFGFGIMLMFVAIGARVPHEIARPFLDGVWPLWRGDKPLPPWVFGNRYARNLVTIPYPDSIRSLPSWAGWITLVPLSIFQTSMLVLITRMIRGSVIEIKASEP